MFAEKPKKDIYSFIGRFTMVSAYSHVHVHWSLSNTRTPHDNNGSFTVHVTHMNIYPLE